MKASARASAAPYTALHALFSHTQGGRGTAAGAGAAPERRPELPVAGSELGEEDVLAAVVAACPERQPRGVGAEYSVGEHTCGRCRVRGGRTGAVRSRGHADDAGPDRRGGVHSDAGGGRITTSATQGTTNTSVHLSCALVPSSTPCLDLSLV